MLMKKPIIFFALFTLVACHSEVQNKASVINSISNSDTLRAILQIKDSIFESSMDAYLEATILNTSNTTHEVNASQLQQAVLAVEVFDKKGVRVPTIPPSVPLPTKHLNYIRIKPMEAFITTYDLHIFDPPLPDGSYTIRMKNMPSNQISFEINAHKND